MALISRLGGGVGNVTRALTDPVLGYNFAITLVEASSSPLSVLNTVVGGLENVILGGFSECSGLEMKLEVDSQREGGNNGTVLKFPSNVTWSTIRLKRGVTLSDLLWNWHYDFVQGKGTRRNGVIALLNDLRIPVKVWYFKRGLPVRWTGPSLNAMQGQVAVEELEIVHEGLSLFTPGTLLESRTGVSF
jgi:phage tail-like protein